MAAGLGLLLVLYVAATLYARPGSPGTHLRYDEFVSDLRAGKIRSANILNSDRRIVGTFDGGSYWIDYGSSDISPIFSSLLVELQHSSSPVSTDQQWLKGLLGGPQVTILLPSLIIVDALLLTLLLVQAGGLSGFGRSGSRRVGSGGSRITFAEVAGAEEAVEELAEIRDFLADPTPYLAMGARVPRGILLIGPPGCGKTLLAKAVAGEAGVPFFSISGSAFVELYVGVGAARIRDLFREAQEAAPAIVFIDELDAVGRGRSSGAANGQEERESSLNQLLVGLDGFDPATGVVVLAATNRPDVLDPALLRPGRFDRRVVVDVPDLAGRRGILSVHARGKPLAADADLEAVARRTPGFSGADLASVLNEAAMLAARRGRPAISTALLWEAVERVIAGPERRSRLLGPREKELVAYHEAGHALVSAILIPNDRVSKVSVVSRGGQNASMTLFLPEEERHLSTRADLAARLAMLMGGRAAEELVAGEPTSRAEDDLQRAAELARRMVRELGMSDQLGPMSLRPEAGFVDSGESTQPSQELAALADREVRRLLLEAKAAAAGVLADHRPALDRLALRLQETESLEGTDLDAILYPVGLAVGP